MQAHRLSGKVDDTGQLIVTETVNLPPGEVEIIVLQKPAEMDLEIAQSLEARPTKIRFLREWGLQKRNLRFLILMLMKPDGRH